jgi:hypothetical protein
MAFKHVVAPTKGYVTNRPSTGLEDRMSPSMRGIILRDGEARSDFGMSQYPVAGDLKTNALNGTVMRIDQLFLLNGNSHLLAFTTTNIYEYNTSTTTWDCITRGTLVHDGEAAWDAQSNVTSTADTSVKLRGSASAKHIIASGFTTGIVSSDDFASKDVTSETHVTFWAYCDTTTAADVFALRLSEQNTGGTGATYADYNIPALTAGEWKHITLALASPDASDGGTYPADLNALLSVAIVANSDPGAVTIYVDDIRTTVNFTGDEDNKFSTATLNDVMIVTNGVDAPFQITSGATHSTLTLNLVAGAITTSEVVIAFKDHMLYMNNTENGGDAPQRATWTNIGSNTDLTGGTSGFQDLIDDESWIIGAAILSENEIAIYKERAVVQCVWVGGQTPFRFQTVVAGTGAINKDCITEIGGGHMILGPDVTYVYKGVPDIEIVDDDIKRTMYGRMDGAYLDRAFLMYVEEDDELQVWLPVGQTTPDEGYTYDVVNEVWYLKNRNISGYGYYQAQSSITIGDLVGTIGEQDWTFGSQLIKQFFPITLVGDANGKIFNLDKTTLDNDGTAIENEFQTPDFVLPDTPEYMSHSMRVHKLIFEAKGQSVTTEYSIDGGASWNPTQGAASNTTSLVSIYKDYEQDFETDARRIRFKFLNTTAASGFQLRHYGFNWNKRSGRK